QIEKRRKLIKSAVGAPALFTLPGAVGSAMAAASLGCDVKSQAAFADESSVEGFPSSARDKWMRVRCEVWQFKIVGATGPAVDGFKFNGAYYFVTDGVAEQVAVDANPAPKQVANAYVYALVDYQQGAPATIVLDPGNAVSPIAGASCWNSLTSSNLTTNVIN
ncbi:MAG: hypothetical protein KDH16_19810, partial [Rhodocyclaceae bacterium]|nr:hypothetical protein [Rhodocyclaceae bacterium]